MAKEAFGTYEIARLCHVAPSTAGRWVEEGKLPSFRTAGGRRRVWRKDLVEFLKSLGIPVPPELEAGGVFRVLLVDDDEVVRRFLAQVVRRLRPEAEVHEAGDGFEAGRKAAGLRPDLVVLDLGLPGVDGFEVCRAMREDPAIRGARILAISGMPRPESERLALAAGADGFLAKPLDLAALSARLERLLGEGARRAAGAPEARR